MSAPRVLAVGTATAGLFLLWRGTGSGEVLAIEAAAITAALLALGQDLRAALTDHAIATYDAHTRTAAPAEDSTITLLRRSR